MNASRWSLLVSLLANAALAGDFHTQTFDAKVTALVLVKSHAFDDRLASLEGTTPVVLRGGPACSISLEIADAFFKGPQVVFASRQACEVLGRRPTIRVQYLGLATAYQFVAMQLDGVWRTLPLMKRTESRDENVRACLNAEPTAPHCAPETGKAL